MDLTAAVILAMGIAAAWDSFRRYCDTTKFNQALVDSVGACARETSELRQQLSDVKQRMALQTGSVSTRTSSLRGVNR